MELLELVSSTFNQPGRCNRHCENATALKIVPEEAGLLGIYSCPGGYVSRLVRFGVDYGADSLLEDVNEVMTSSPAAADDIRVASRYAWDLDAAGGGSGSLFKEAYWTQNYGKARKDDPSRPALFLCSNCEALFEQPFNSSSAKCSKCAAEGA